MHLSRHDLVQLDDAYLGGLDEASLRALSARLVADLKEAHERLEQNPSNSSRPPSSRAPWEAAASDEAPSGPVAERTEVGDAVATPEEAPPEAQADAGDSGERPEPGRPGAPGHGRTQCLAVHEEQHRSPQACAVCARPLSEAHKTRTDSAHYCP